MISQDEYATVYNSQDTYKGLAQILDEGPVVIAWTDEAGTQLDILLVLHGHQLGRLQRGMSMATDLFVAVSSFGMFGFEVNELLKDPGYVSAKLNLGGTENTTSIKLADLINGVIKEVRTA